MPRASLPSIVAPAITQIVAWTTALTLSCTLLAGAAAADVYKYQDEFGNVLYTDKPRTLPAERLNVQSKKTDMVAVQARQDAEMQRLQEQEQSRHQAAANRGEEQAAAQLSAKDKAERCIKARERYETYINSQKLYEQLPDGERRYLDDSELAAARAAAKASMDLMCQ
ncbi:hypothetical protein ACG33_14735 [Steroidobacter denitrificans]|uniref:DUF4124 domain-containing protein n=1 Tax=Steroidobacter denitrificans TaxID=465721 RepID=A0A127FEN2_STEDE|nr:DUF4124 domain-containing protein [Steroidobacter denitrificans]AMN48328.1 hypothetical protein ACG33_14735 [Steroidobacter denitrificans]